MNSLIFLKAAYAAAWLGYLGYLWRILLRMKKVAAERAELERTSGMRSSTGPVALKTSVS